MKVHSKNRPFLCPYCKKGLKSKPSLANHLKIMHNNATDFPIVSVMTTSDSKTPQSFTDKRVTTVAEN